jgi:MOSC domain-containing protein YiiM
MKRIQGDFTVHRANQLMLHEQDNRSEISNLVQVAALAEEWKRQFTKVLFRKHLEK